MQQLLEERGAAVWELLRLPSTRVFVCGGTEMGRGVQVALAAVAERHGGLDAEGGRAFLNAMRGEGRLVSELWG